MIQGYMRINPRANTPDMEATLFGSHQSWRRTLPESPGIYRSSKYTVLPSPRTLVAPLILQGLCGIRDETKPRTNDLYIIMANMFSPVVYIPPSQPS